MRGRKPLVGNVGKFDQHKYWAIVKNHILPFAYNVYGGPADFAVQENNCELRKAESVATYLANKHFKSMYWPTKSLELDPIENVWAS